MNPTVHYLLLADESMCTKSKKRKEEIEQEIDCLFKSSPEGACRGYDLMVERATKSVDHEAIRQRLEDLSKIVSLSHIATEYMHRSPGWLYQRIKGTLVHGKPARFTRVQLLLLQLAFDDVSKILGSVNLFV